MSELKQLISKCESLYEDLSLSYVKEWKIKQKSKAVGFLPVYIPRELIYAAGMLPVGIMGGGDRVEIIKGDAYFQSYICRIPRSVIEMGLNGQLDDLDGMMFPSICDVIRNLSGIWKLMFKDKVSIYYDAPQNFKSEIGGKFYQEELSRMLVLFEEMSGVKADDDRLREAISLYNENRQLIDELYKRRSSHPWQVPTSELYLLLRAGNIIDVQEHNKMVRRYLDLVAKTERRPMDNSRIILRGVFCEQPPLGLIRALERSGGYIVDDDFIMVMRWIKSQISLQGNLIANISNSFLKDSMEGPFKFQPHKKGEDLLQSCRENKADGVIFCAASFCDPGLLDHPMLQKRLSENKISYTSFQYAENTAQFNVIREQAGTFSDSVKLWGEA